MEWYIREAAAALPLILPAPSLWFFYGLADVAEKNDQRRTPMGNPFEETGGEFLVLVNEENQHSLWPATTSRPPGWRTTFGPETRQRCLAYVDEHWTDMRPASLIAAMRDD